MLARFLTRLMDAQGIWAKPLGDFVHRIMHAVFGAMPAVRDVLVGRWLGHPIHPAITDVPIGILFLVIVFDVTSQGEAAVWALSIGILAMIGAALAGYADYADTDGKARERATVHSTLMVAALIGYVVSLLLRFPVEAGAVASAPAVWLSIASFVVMAAGAYVGGDVVYVLGNMVSRHAFRGAGTKWVVLEPAEVDADGSLPEGRLIRAKLGINQLVLVRQGDTILALHDTCAHAGGPLNEGRLVDGQVECPWHYSRYRMTDGHVTRGPSVYDQPAYEVRARDGGGWEARRRAV